MAGPLHDDGRTDPQGQRIADEGPPAAVHRDFLPFGADLLHPLAALPVAEAGHQGVELHRPASLIYCAHLCLSHPSDPFRKEAFEGYFQVGGEEGVVNQAEPDWQTVT